MNLLPLYLFIAVIASVLAYGVVIIDDRKLRTVLLVMLLGVIGVANHVQVIEHDERIDSANQQIIDLVKCHGEHAMCSWSTK